MTDVTMTQADDRCPHCGSGSIFWDDRHRTAHSGEGRSNGAGEDALRAAVKHLRGKAAGFRANAKRQKKRVGPLASSFELAALEIEDKFTAILTAPPASDAGMREALEKAAGRFEAINNFGDPYEIAENPGDFGGTDDGGETVCMAYENMQGIAAAGARECRAVLSQSEGAK